MLSQKHKKIETRVSNTSSKVINLLEELKEAFHHIEGLHHPLTVQHEDAVSEYMYVFARHLRMEEKKARNLLFAGKLHDIGKVAIKIEILDKPGSLDPFQRTQIAEHTRIGHCILKKINHPLMDLAANLALHHHENFDGSGYPSGLKANDIPFAARICSLCDVYDALRRKRSYKNVLSHQAVVHLMLSKEKEGLAYKFDPELLREFELAHPLFENMAPMLHIPPLISLSGV